MAVIVQPDPYQALIRKMGYSVGLEKLVERVKKLVGLYVKAGTINAVAFKDLIEVDFGRKNASEHFANFYGTLNLVRVIVRDQGGIRAGPVRASRAPKSLEPLYLLDALSILRRLFEADDDKFETATKVVLSQAIVEADGDIFLNALVSDFQSDELKSKLMDMLVTKRTLLRSVMRTQTAKIDQIINIKNESKVAGHQPEESAPPARFGKRTRPLSASRRTLQLGQEVEKEISIPADYIDKVRITRKGWAQELGWFVEQAKSEAGTRFIEQLVNHVVSMTTHEGALLFWGYASDLQRIRLKPSDLEAPSCESWDLLCAISSAYQNSSAPRDAIKNADELFELLRTFHELYRSGNTTRGLIRNSLPLYVAEPALVAWCVAQGKHPPALAAMLDAEYNKKVRRIQRMTIRGTAGALHFSGG